MYNLTRTSFLQYSNKKLVKVKNKKIRWTKMLFKIILELLLERKYLPKQAKELVISVYPTINSKQSNKNIILLSDEIVQDPNVLFSICRLIYLKLSLYEYWKSPHPTLIIDGRATITVLIIIINCQDVILIYRK